MNYQPFLGLISSAKLQLQIILNRVVLVPLFQRGRLEATAGDS